jgi:hypothetical protein
MNSTSLIPYTSLVRRFQAAPHGKLYCLHGDRSVFRLSLYAASHVLLRDIPVAVVDGSNRFDLYYITDFARKTAVRRLTKQPVTPEQLLERIFISRAFTCYQMEAAITERLPAFVHARRSPIVIIFGLLDTFYDEQAPLFEAKAGLHRIIGALEKLKQQHVSVLLASLDMKLESKERNGLFPHLKSVMDHSFYVTEDEVGQRIVHEPQGRYERAQIRTQSSR